MTWQLARYRVPMHYKSAEEQRLHDLALALVIPWRDGFPQYYIDDKNERQRLDEIREATKDERLPWEK